MVRVGYGLILAAVLAACGPGDGQNPAASQGATQAATSAEVQARAEPGPAADISRVAILGTWAGESGYGDVRLIERVRGGDSIVVIPSLDWTRYDPDRQSSIVVARTPLPSCDSSPLEGAAASDWAQTEMDGGIELVVDAAGREIAYEVGGPGEIRLISGC